jgi:putative membrane protein
MKLLALFVAMALPSLAFADKAKTEKADKAKTEKAERAKLDDADQKLIAHVHAVNKMEIDAGKLAQDKGTPPVKQYGQMLQRDHQDADKDLTAFAKTRGIANIPADVAPTEAAKKDHAEMMAKMAELKKVSGAEFDRQFLMMMVNGHDAEIGRLTAAIPTIKDQELATKMTDIKPILQRHADAARELQKNAPTAKR